ncbi:pimeloyl-CoA dehydrogenase large subunit [Paracoccus sp. M683]|uniref:acyl-CoA dehydrogenase family protein n=1 Tax=Paracoccus sp. M683 TaxID=2594268 RepID=UPI00117E217C|nr:acyl-CoA dehydrogenase family protein [Paracoccus sp. M683]TRW97811.1 pimeloyl-CoA dehydrogenase large subunit [Paracoccus sp. M683]
MDLNFTPEELAFRDEVRAFLRESLPLDISDAVRRGGELGADILSRFHALLNGRGWLGYVWPRDHGGTGWNAIQRHIFEEEMAAADCPRILPFGVNMLGPVLIKFGSEAQKSHYLPRILDGTDWWCQGYSEPGAGSDLASLRTRAVRDGDDWVLNGQKTWTTLGQYANRIFVLARTRADGKPQEGISFFLVDLDNPGIEMRPIRLLEGGHEVNEVFFTDARIPADALVGEENQGWTIAKYLLTHERTNIAGVGRSYRALAQLKDLARQTMRDGRPLIDDPLFAARLAEVEIDLEAMNILNLRMLDQAQKRGQPGAETSMLKIKGSVIRQEISDLARRVLGPAAAPFPGSAPDNLALLPEDAVNNAADYFNMRKMSIYGGSNEIQRNILTKAVLRL